MMRLALSLLLLLLLLEPSLLAQHAEPQPQQAPMHATQRALTT